MKKNLLKISLLLLPVITLSLLNGCSADKEKTPKADWSFKASGKIESTPISIEKSIIFGDNEKNVYAVDIESQKEKWKFQSDGPIKNSLVADGTTVIFSTDSTCYALDSKTGKELWHYTAEGGRKAFLDEWDHHSPSPIIYNNSIIFSTMAGDIYSLNKSTGAVEWKYKGEGQGELRATPFIEGDVMVFGDSLGNCYAMDLKTKKTLWKNNIGQQLVCGTVIYKDNAYFAGRDSITAAYGLKDGSKKWLKLDQGSSWLPGELVAKDDLIYVPGSDNKKITTFKYDSGEEVEGLSVKGSVFAKPFILGENLYCVDGDAYENKYGTVYGFNMKTKKEVFKKEYSFPITSSPIVVDNFIYFGGNDGNLYALNLSEGK